MAQLRIGDDTHQTLRELARIEGTTMQVILDRALSEYRRKQFFDSLTTAFRALKGDRKAWAEEQQEREAWATVVSDDLEQDEIWTEDGNVVGNS